MSKKYEKQPIRLRMPINVPSLVPWRAMLVLKIRTSRGAVKDMILQALLLGKIAQQVRTEVLYRVPVVHIPNPGSAIIAGGDNGFSVRGEYCPLYRTKVAGEAPQFLAGL